MSYRWNFGDGTSSTEASPSHAYAKPGIYTLELTITNEAGTSRTASNTVYVADFDIVRDKQCSGSGNTGWCWQRPVPQGNALYDYFFVDDSHGWAVGELGTVLSTADGGMTWQAQQSGTNLPLTKVLFVDSQVGWVVAGNGQLLKTADGGAHWSLLSSGLSNGIYSLDAADGQRAWIKGQNSELMATADGGASWSRINMPQSYAYSIVLVNGTTAWASSWSDLQRTTDGTSWSSVALPSAEPGMSRSMGSLYAVSADQAWVLVNDYGWVNNNYVSRTVLLRTADGGAHWNSFDAGSIGGMSVRFFDASNGFAWSYYGGPALRTTDGGATWQTLTLPQTQYSYYTQFKPLSARQLVVSDASGHLYRSTDGGSTWQERQPAYGTGPVVNGIWFFDAREGLATAADGSMLRTTDGGQNWTASTPQNQIGWRRPQFLSDGAGWVISDSGTIYRSSDKGNTWLAPAVQNSPAMGSVSDFHFIDALHGWAVSQPGWGGANAFFNTEDGGMSWHAVAGASSWQGFLAIRFADATHGVAVGPAGVALVTSDGGNTWHPRATNTTKSLRRVTFLDAQTAVAVGDQGGIVRSTDQGQSWTEVNSGYAANLQDVRFVSSTTGWAVGDGGTVLVTRDGGRSWSSQSARANVGLTSVFFLDEQTGWVTGSNGAVLATATGGR